MTKKIVVYLISISLLIIILVCSGSLLKILHEQCAKEYTMMKYFWIQWGLFVFLGILLGFGNQFVSELKKSGSWKVDVAKIIIWGLPLGWLASSYLIYFSGITTGFISYITFYMISIEWGPIVVAQVILGYIIITSFYKKAH